MRLTSRRKLPVPQPISSSRAAAGAARMAAQRGAQRHQRLPAHRRGAAAEQHLDLIIVAFGRGLAQIAVALEMEHAPVIARIALGLRVAQQHVGGGRRGGGPRPRSDRRRNRRRGAARRADCRAHPRAGRRCPASMLRQSRSTRRHRSAISRCRSGIVRPRRLAAPAPAWSAARQAPCVRKTTRSGPPASPRRRAFPRHWP